MQKSDCVTAGISALLFIGLVFAAGESPTIATQLLSVSIGLVFWAGAYLLYKKHENLFDDEKKTRNPYVARKRTIGIYGLTRQP